MPRNEGSGLLIMMCELSLNTHLLSESARNSDADCSCSDSTALRMTMPEPSRSWPLEECAPSRCPLADRVQADSQSSPCPAQAQAPSVTTPGRTNRYARPPRHASVAAACSTIPHPGHAEGAVLLPKFCRAKDPVIDRAKQDALS